MLCASLTISPRRPSSSSRWRSFCQRAWSRGSGVVRTDEVSVSTAATLDRFLLFLVGQLLAEALDAALGVDDLLLARVERVALGADFDLQLLLGGARREGVAAHAAR